MKHVKWVSIVVLCLIIVIVVLQNTESVETRILFASITMPRAVLLCSTTLIGFALGVIASFVLRRRGRTDSNEKVAKK